MSMNNQYAIAFQNYVRDFAPDLYGRMFYDFKTAQIATPHEGVKGELIITEIGIGDNLARRWGKTFNPLADVVTPKPKKLKTALNKVDFSICPTDFESSYLGAFRQKGQSVIDFPFEAYIMDKVMGKLNQEFEVAMWQANEQESPSDGDYLRETFDGYLTIIAAAIAAGDITAVATGAVTSANALTKFKDMWDTVDPVYKEMGTDILVSFSVYDAYRKHYKDTYKFDVPFVEVTNAGYRGIQYEYGNGNATIIPVYGMGSSGRIVMTPRENLHYGIDDPSDVQFNVEAEKRELHFWMDFRMGTQILLQDTGILAVNDQA